MITQPTFNTQLQAFADYTKPGVTRKNLAKDEHTQFSLICLTAETKMPEHTAARNVSITVIEGHGVLTLKGQEITLQPGVFVYMPANTPHALRASSNLAFLHT
ncbi:MAG: cupin domain-containing protein [Aphanocapsa sp. GSE-SYN-MK-11-07L]|jgi:quercetin dioxygenase-like cupin family protein|nr:cupin domain-containing protein [Aphanocapsa sp. GSE-SYN-MK-11-07L]